MDTHCLYLGYNVSGADDCILANGAAVQIDVLRELDVDSHLYVRSDAGVFARKDS
jgi:hypothetical protein